MPNEASFRQHIVAIANLYRAHWYYLLTLDFFLLVLTALGGGALFLAYLANFPFLVTAAIGIIFIAIATIATTGVAKNFYALARGRGPAKYPLFIREYFYLGLPVIFSSLISYFLPLFVLDVFGIYCMTHQSFNRWWFLPVISFYLLWQLVSGLAPAILIDKKCSFSAAFFGSWRLFTYRPRLCCCITFFNQMIFLISHFLPVIGPILAANWLFLSQCQLEALLAPDILPATPCPAY